MGIFVRDDDDVDAPATGGGDIEVNPAGLDWATGVFYEENQLVIHNSRSRICTVSHTSEEDATHPDNTKFRLLNSNDRWQPDTRYLVGDFVVDDSSGFWRFYTANANFYSGLTFNTGDGEDWEEIEYIGVEQKNVANGVAGLDGDGKLLGSQIPDSVVASGAERVDLGTLTTDAILTDPNGGYEGVLADDIVITIPAPDADRLSVLTLLLTQDGTGGWEATFDTEVGVTIRVPTGFSWRTDPAEDNIITFLGYDDDLWIALPGTGNPPPAVGGARTHQIATEETTIATAAADLTTVGPTLTFDDVAVGDLFEWFAEVELKTSDAAQSAVVFLHDGTTANQIMSKTGATTYEKKGSQPSSSVGNSTKTQQFMGSFIATSGGSRTFKLQYRSTNAAATATFKNRTLVMRHTPQAA